MFLDQSPTELVRTTVSNNLALLKGGGVAARNGSLLTLVDTNIQDNEATNFGGGGLFVANQELVLSGNTRIRRNHSVSGGGIFFVQFGAFHITTTDPNPTLRVPKISFNTARDGGAVLVEAASILPQTINMTGGWIHDNEATGDGGGVYFDGTNPAELTLVGVTIEDNEALSEGGGVYVGDAATATIRSSTLHKNTSGGLGGGGVYVKGMADLTIEGSHITSNRTTGDGGGIRAAANATVTIRGVFPGGCDNPLLLPSDTYCGSIDGNVAATGGAIGGGQADFDIETISIRTNSATGDGEAVSLSGGTLNMTNVLISQTAGGSGLGELRLSSAAAATLQGVTLVSKQTSSNPSTFANYGPPVSATSNSSLSITESIVATGAPMTGGAIATVPATCTLFTSVDPSTNFTGPIRIHGPGAEPDFFTDPIRGPWRLGASSKALNSCIALSSDLDGVGRVVKHDMGALERP